MAQRLNRLLAGLLLAAGAAWAETLPDPTRPAIGASQDAASAGAPAAAGPRLQLIKISPARRSAVIDGQEVTIGSRLGDMRVVQISEGEVVLRGKGGSETLRLFADVEKRPAAPAPGAKGLRSTKKKTDAEASRKAQP